MWEYIDHAIVADLLPSGLTASDLVASLSKRVDDKKMRFIEEQIVGVLTDAEAGLPVKEPLEQILRHTLAIPIFQEQIMQIAMVRPALHRARLIV